jgi:hypothetical protein
MRLVSCVFLTIFTVGCQQFVRHDSDRKADSSDIQQASYDSEERDRSQQFKKDLPVPLSKQYDLYCALFTKEPTVYRNCRILGITGAEERKSSSFSSKSISLPYEWYDGMLVLEMPDGRRAYVPTKSVKYFEESAPITQSGYTRF